MDRVDVVERDELLDLDAARALGGNSLELGGRDRHVAAGLDLVALDDLLVRHFLAVDRADALLLDAAAVGAVQLVEAHVLARDRRIDLDGHHHEPERDGAAPDCSSHASRLPRSANGHSGQLQNSPATPTSTSAQRSTDSRSAHSSVSCAPSPPGPKIDARNARLGEDRGVHPGGPADDRRWHAQHERGVPVDEPHDVGVDRNLEWRAHQGRAHLGAQLRVGARGLGHELAHLLLDQLGALPRHRAALELDEAALGVARELLPALDQRRVHRPGPEQRMPLAAGEPPAEVLDAGQHAAGLGDGVHAELWLRAVCGDGP